MKKELVEPYFNNLFTLLSADRGNKIFEKKSLLLSAKETGTDRSALKEIYSRWVAGKGEMILPDTAAEATALVHWLCAGLMYDDEINDKAVELLIGFSEKTGIPGSRINGILKAREKFVPEPSLKKRYALILNGNDRAVAAQQPHAAPSARKKPAKPSDFYIANQVCTEGLDELQRLILACRLGVHAALDGPPGVGKTKSVIEVSRILGMDLFTKTCSARTTESHIISHPVLATEGGASITSHVNGPLTLAMEKNGIFYGDEFNLLKEDVQKRLNSAFDERRYIDRNDGVQIKSGPGFWAVISYNPARNMISRDLEDSVADRFVHLHYSRWSSDFKAYVSHRSASGGDPKAADDDEKFNISLGWRGIYGGRHFAKGVMDDKKLKWYDFFTGKELGSEPEYIYRVYDRGSLMTIPRFSEPSEVKILDGQAFNPVNLARIISKFTEMLYSLSKNGESPMLARMGLGNILKEEDLEILTLHESSARIEIAALRHYEELVSRGFNRFLAQSYATRLVIDQICYGQYRDRKLRNATVYEIVIRMAQALRLLCGGSAFNTGFNAESILAK